MSHLHLPDGLLPVTVWGSALALAIALLALSGRVLRDQGPREVAFRGALGALVLAAMSLHLPLGPFEYHLSLLGPIGVLLGAAAGFQVVFVVSAMLALVGHGGLTVVGLNALVLGAGVAVARPVYAAVARGGRVGLALACAAASSQAVAGTLWVVIVGIALRTQAATAPARRSPELLPLALGAVLALWVLGVVVEAFVAAGLGRFLARVKPELLPRSGRLRTATAEA
jgi:cobalt/nickel transport system permease protein